MAAEFSAGMTVNRWARSTAWTTIARTAPQVKNDNFDPPDKPRHWLPVTAGVDVQAQVRDDFSGRSTPLTVVMRMLQTIQQLLHGSLGRQYRYHL
ncbi:hypothetical protein [Gordonia oryzae]|uniref:hypothetical protein n=1 Tax=Gordonia oryzae TaxID=2487349 RepID=UPI000F5132ED|nr:hypothetical protein [Gordonia oryzae]